MDTTVLSSKKFRADLRIDSHLRCDKASLRSSSSKKYQLEQFLSMQTVLSLTASRSNSCLDEGEVPISQIQKIGEL